MGLQPRAGAAAETPPPKSACKKSKQKKADDKKDKKDEKKKKKRGSSHAITFHVGIGILNSIEPGTSSSSNGNESQNESEEESLDEILNEAQSLLGLRTKDLVRSGNMVKLEDLSARQLAYVMCGSCTVFMAADLYDLGGEMESWIQHHGHPSKSCLRNSSTSPYSMKKHST